MRYVGLLVVAIAVGGLLPVQGALNARIGRVVHHPLQVPLISTLVSQVMLCAWLLAIGAQWPSLSELQAETWYYYPLAGVLGTMFVTAMFALTPVIGAAATSMSMIVGQVVLAVLLDHFGALGLETRPINIYTALGCAGLVLSLFLIQGQGRWS